MSKPTFVDCNGLAGFMSYGFVQSGMEMKARTGTLDFGNPVAELNRHLLGNQWESFFSDNEDEWPVENADVVLGCPPCSGWSVWAIGQRGPDAAAHEHTRAFMRYAAKVKPKMIIFECVQQAYTQGRDVMVKYRDMVEDLSGKEYDLYHVKMNNLQVGGFSYRARYFWVAAEKGMPFGAQAIAPKEMPTVMDVIGDLQDMEITWDAQRYSGTPTKFVEHLRNKSGIVDGHMNRVNMTAVRINEIFDILGNDGWKPMMKIDDALREAVDKNGGKFPQNWESLSQKILDKDFYMGFSVPCRWSPDTWAHVLTGGALEHIIHPTRARRITHREAARIQGLPDDWQFSEARGYSALAATWGKAVAAQAANWIGDAAVAALDGQPNGPQGELIGEREWLLDTDKGFSRQFVARNWYPNRTSYSTKKRADKGQ
jgi:site-specific DNA-cytosine methylase